jgi:hypothetical protein
MPKGYSAYNTEKKLRARVELRCKLCGKTFYTTKGRVRSKGTRYCSGVCSRASLIRPERWGRYECANCGKTLNRLKNKAMFKNLFCNRKCLAEHRVKHPVHCGNGKWLESGYVVVYRGKNKPIKEHRLVMENHLGRKLLPSEHIHHINGDVKDNQIDNLMVMTKEAHVSLHRRQEVDGGKVLFGGRRGNAEK